jgi:hypothetical protein
MKSWLIFEFALILVLRTVHGRHARTLLGDERVEHGHSRYDEGEGDPTHVDACRRHYASMRLSERHEATDEAREHQAERGIVTTPTKLTF